MFRSFKYTYEDTLEYVLRLFSDLTQYFHFAKQQISFLIMNQLVCIQQDTFQTKLDYIVKHIKYS